VAEHADHALQIQHPGQRRRLGAQFLLYAHEDISIADCWRMFRRSGRRFADKNMRKMKRVERVPIS